MNPFEAKHSLGSVVRALVSGLRDGTVVLREPDGASPAAPPADQDVQASLIQKVTAICERVVRGIHATDRWQPRYHRFSQIASLLCFALGSAGLFAARKSADPTSETGWPILAPLLALAFGALLQLSNQLGIERTAVRARSAATAFALIQTHLEEALAGPTPMSHANYLQEEADALGRVFHDVVREPSPELAREAADLARDLVSKHGPTWGLSSARKPVGPRQ